MRLADGGIRNIVQDDIGRLATGETISAELVIVHHQIWTGSIAFYAPSLGHNRRMSTHPPYRIGILADDLTSAADGAGPFVDRGLTAVVGRGQLPSTEAAIVAVDSQSRSASARHAAQRVAQFTTQLAPREILYKTSDSTLRGHLKAELEAAFRRAAARHSFSRRHFPMRAARRSTASSSSTASRSPRASMAATRFIPCGIRGWTHLSLRPATLSFWTP